MYVKASVVISERHVNSWKCAEANYIYMWLVNIPPISDTRTFTCDKHYAYGLLIVQILAKIVVVVSQSVSLMPLL